MTLADNLAGPSRLVAVQQFMRVLVDEGQQFVAAVESGTDRDPFAQTDPLGRTKLFFVDGDAVLCHSLRQSSVERLLVVAERSEEGGQWLSWILRQLRGVK